jgi:tetratricopeptide (TPR) repeat protein
MKKSKLKAKAPTSNRQLRAATKNQYLSLDIVDFLGLAAIFVLGFLIYSNTFNASFHFDDVDHLEENPAIRSLSNIRAIWEYSHTRFLAYYSFAWNYHFSQLNVWGYHLVNLMIHIATAGLVYWLTCLIFTSPVLKDKPIAKDKKVVAFITAMLFVSHPLATQSVTYIIQRMSSMAAMFYLLSIVFYIMGRYTLNNNKKKYLLFAGCGLSAVCAMLTKENAFTLPFAILLVEFFFLQTGKKSISFKDYRVILAGVGLVIFIALTFSKFSSFITTSFAIDTDSPDKSLTASSYLYTQFSVIVKYIQLLLVPLNQNLDYDYKLVHHFTDSRSLQSFFVLLALLALAVYLFKKQRIFSFGIFWFFLTLSIESSIIPLQDLIFEHRTYLPSFGFFLCMSYGIYLLTWKNYKKVGTAALVLIIGTFAVLSFTRNSVWKDEITLWSDVIKKSPKKARPYNNRGDDYLEQNKLQEAFSDFNKALELNPRFAMAYYNRANYYKKEGNFEKAIDDYDMVIHLWPQFHKAFSNRGNIYKLQNNLDEAVRNYTQAISLSPTYYLGYNNRASVYIMQNKNAEAIQDLNESVKLKPDFAEAYANRGLAQLNLGNYQMGCLDLKQAVDLGFQPAAEVMARNCK